jgi:hypothetical protein
MPLPTKVKHEEIKVNITSKPVSRPSFKEPPVIEKVDKPTTPAHVTETDDSILDDSSELSDHPSPKIEIPVIKETKIIPDPVEEESNDDHLQKLIIERFKINR